MASSNVNAAQVTEQHVQHVLVQPLQQASVLLAAGTRIFDVTAASVVAYASRSASCGPMPQRSASGPLAAVASSGASAEAIAGCPFLRRTGQRRPRGRTGRLASSRREPVR